jgi:hypothetical protein
MDTEEEAFMNRVLCLVLLFGVLAVLPVLAADNNTPTPDQPATRGRMSPEMRQEMMQRLSRFIDNLMVMGQNTSVVTPTGVIVLQGNNLLQYSNDLTLRRTVALPIPPIAIRAITPPDDTGGAALPAMPPMPPLRSMIPAKLLVMANGDLTVVRGLQLLRFDQDLKLINQATLAPIPPLTPDELAAVAPIGAFMSMMLMMGPMAGGGPDGGGMPGPEAPTPPYIPPLQPGGNQ